MITKFIYLLFLLFAVSSLLIGNTLYEQGEDLSVVKNLSWDENWNRSYYENLYPEDENVDRLNRIVYRMIDFAGFSMFESIKWGAEFGYENPQYDYEFLFEFIKFTLILLVVAAFVPLVIPLIAIITIIFMGIGNLIKRIRNKK